MQSGAPGGRAGLPVKGPELRRLFGQLLGRLPAAAPLLLLFPALFFLITAACGGGPAPALLPTPTPTPAPTPTPTPPPDPQAILSRAAARVAATESLAFVLEHPSGSTRISPGLLLTRAEGVVNRPAAAGVDTPANTPADTPANAPGNFRITLDLEVSGSILQVSVIAVEEGAFITNLFSGQWERTEREAVPFRLDNAAQTFAGLISGVQSPELAGEERLAAEGYTAYRLRGTLPAAALGQLVPAILADPPDPAGPGVPEVPVEIWADRAEIRLPRALLAGPLSPGDAAEARRLLTLEALAPPAEITAPAMGN